MARARNSFQLQMQARLDAASGVSDWWLHDLRRTVATGLQRLGVRLEVIPWLHSGPRNWAGR
jgi:hypothetical protein